MWAALFPGQGSQSVGMGRFFYDHFATAKDLFVEASDVLHQDFKKLCFEGPEGDLNLTENTQPALLLVSTCAFRCLQEKLEVPFQAAAGHSVGEYAALVAAGTLSFSSALQAVRARGRAMQNAVPVGQGAMAAVMGLDDDQVRTLCEWATKESGLRPVEPANFNAPGQVVISGRKDLIEWIQAHLTPDIFAQPPRRMKLIPLKVSAPFHCSMMAPAQEEMAPLLTDMPFAKPHFPVVQNVTAQPESDPERLRENLIAQISAPVRWVEGVQALRQLGAQRCIELGSGKVLSGLMKKIDSAGWTSFNIGSLDDFKSLEEARESH